MVLFALKVLKIGAIQGGVFSVIVAFAYAFWLAGAAREYAELPEPLTPEAKKAGGRGEGTADGAEEKALTL